MIVENRRVRAHVDKTLIILVFALSIFGVVAVCVATFPANSTATSFLGHIAESNSAVRQLIFLAVAPFILGVVMNIKYAFLRRFAGILYLGSTLLVLVVLLVSALSAYFSFRTVRSFLHATRNEQVG